MNHIPFLKMHGTGNDFVVIDNRSGDLAIDSGLAVRMAARRFGIGCDQLVVMEAAQQGDVRMRIFNADGGEVPACGNASRCIGWRIMEEDGSDQVTIETQSGLIKAFRGEEPLQVSVDMGEPKWQWQEIPLTEPRNTEHLGIASGPLMDPVAVNMGNPHMVFFVNDLEFVSISTHGPKLETHPLFKEGCNVSAVQVIGQQELKLLVWERGAGETLACGTAACAAVVAGVRRGVCHRRCQVHLPGGTLSIDYRESDHHVVMSGAVAEVFTGEWKG